MATIVSRRVKWRMSTTIPLPGETEEAEQTECFHTVD
jgi:hypothetical protein